jgi:hypothetical protein
VARHGADVAKHVVVVPATPGRYQAELGRDRDLVPLARGGTLVADATQAMLLIARTSRPEPMSNAPSR